METSPSRTSATGAPPEIAYDASGPGTPTGRYLRRFWTPVAQLDDVLPGRAKPITIMGQTFTLYRGESGTPHLLDHLCAHRHVSLAIGSVEGDCIRCFYHGWKYDASGQCVEQPAEDEAFAEKIAVRSYPTREYLGLVFAYLGDDAPPAFPELAAFTKPGWLLTRSYVRKTNYFNALENAVDLIHTNFVHARSDFTALGVNRELPEITCEETPFGIVTRTGYRDGKVGINYLLMPLALYALIAEPGISVLFEHLAYRVPIDAHSHRNFMASLHPILDEDLNEYTAFQEAARRELEQLTPLQTIVDEVIAGELHIDKVPERPDLVYIQDSVVMETQPPLSARPPDRLGKSDRSVILLRRIYAREVTAMLAGTPMKDWAYPTDLRPAAPI